MRTEEFLERKELRKRQILETLKEKSPLSFAGLMKRSGVGGLMGQFCLCSLEHEGKIIAVKDKKGRLKFALKEVERDELELKEL